MIKKSKPKTSHERGKSQEEAKKSPFTTKRRRKRKAHLYSGKLDMRDPKSTYLLRKGAMTKSLHNNEYYNNDEDYMNTVKVSFSKQKLKKSKARTRVKHSSISNQQIFHEKGSNFKYSSKSLRAKKQVNKDRNHTPPPPAIN